MSSATSTSTTSSSSSSVQVAIRVRPFLSAEAGNARCVEIVHHNGIRIGGEQGAQFTFDFCIGGNSTAKANNNSNTQHYVYQTCVEPMTMSCLAGYNATIFAYGQTGSGKTHTVLGGSTHDTEGILPRALRDLFARLEQARDKSNGTHNNCSSNDSADNEEKGEEKMETNENANSNFQFEVRLQFLELYGEEVRDLLSSSMTKLSIRDYGNGGEPEVVGASEVVVSSPEEALLLLERGSFRRVTGATAMNSASSRSHAIISMLIEQQCSTSSNNENEEEEEVEIKRSKFHFVDLAGSERQKRTGATGDRLKEGIDINKGLLALGNVISALGDPKKSQPGKKTFVPYRDSKLTRLLKGSLGGNHKTLMIACISPSASNMDESLCCLRYANRAKNIQNNAVINVDAGSRKLAELRAQVQLLAKECLRVRKIAGEEEVDEKDGVLTLHVLTSLAKGEDVDVQKLQPTTTTTATKNLSSITGTSTSSSASSPRVNDNRTMSLEHNAEFFRMRDASRHLEDKVQSLAQEVFSANAEKEYYRLKLLEHNGTAVGGDDSKEQEVEREAEDCSKSVFIGRMTAYEKEISQLKLRLKEEQATAKSAKVKSSVTRSEGKHEESSSSSNLPCTPPHGALQEEDESDAMNDPRIQKYLNSSEDSFHQDDENDEAHEPDVVNVSMDSACEMNQHLGGVGDGSAKERLDGSVTVLDDSFVSMDSNGDGDDIQDVSFLRRQKTMDAHIVDLSKNIVVKEELLRQLGSMKEKYEDMRHFYETKLRQMESSVRETEKEREDLRRELERLESESKGGADSQQQSARVSAMKQALEDKDSRIATLKLKQSELKNLTKISSRNEQHIDRLKKDVVAMKRQRIDLQKQIKEERKAHADEMKALKKKAQKLDREASKLRHESERKSQQIENAQRLAKTRLEEVGRVRSKYREAEKRLRMQTLKHGVMARAGVDPIMMGRRESKRNTTSSTARKGGSSSRNAPDFNKLRHYLDEKVVEVGKIEESAEKLALEWEDHMRLLAQKEDLVQSGDAENNTNVAEEIESLDVQLSFKEQRIRQLSSRLRKPIQASRGGDISKIDLLLNDANLQSINSGISSVASSQAMVKVLFGMVVRERKRVMALARTASKLDEKALERQKLVESTDAALRTQIAEHLHERTTIANEKQELILSLMSLVKEGESSTASLDAAVTAAVSSEEKNLKSSIISDSEQKDEPPSSSTQSNLVMTLAKQRMAALEQQIVSIQEQNESRSNDGAKIQELTNSLADEKHESERLRNELLFARKALRQIRDSVNSSSSSGSSASSGQPPRSRNSSRSSSPLIGLDHATMPSSSLAKAVHRGGGGGGGSVPTTKAAGDINNVHNIIRRALSRPITPPITSIARSNAVADPKAHNPSHRGEDYMSDTESDDETVPDWADDIMADLHVIAEGGVPESLRVRGKEQDVNDMSNVFNRLANPVYFTGTQKHARNTGNSDEYSSGEHPHTHNSKLQLQDNNGGNNATNTLNHKQQQQQQQQPVKSQSVISLIPQFSSEYATADHDHNPRALAFQPTASANVATASAATDTNANTNTAASSFSSPNNVQLHVNGNSAASTCSVANAKPRRSVYQRLMSPSSYTGTRKSAYEEKKQKQLQQQESLSTSVSCSLLPSADSSGCSDSTNTCTPRPSIPEADSPRQSKANRIKMLRTRSISSESEKNHYENHNQQGTSSAADYSAISSRSEKVLSYTQQNVFERLQHTVTAAYAGKHDDVGEHDGGRGGT